MKIFSPLQGVFAAQTPPAKLLALPVMLLALVVCAGSAARADFNAIAGDWRGQEITEVTGVEIDKPADLTVKVTRAGDGARILFHVGKNFKLELEAGRADGTSIYAAQERSMMGLFKTTAAPQLLSGDSVFWARDTDNGVVCYHAQIGDGGAIDLAHVSLVRENDILRMQFKRRLGDGEVRSMTAVLNPK